MATTEKLQYKIGEACRELDIQPYVLRYWETEFPFIEPSKSPSGQRVYSGEELRVIRRIKELLYDEGYTIAGAKKKLAAELESGPAKEPSPEPTLPTTEAKIRPKPRTASPEPSQSQLDTPETQQIEQLRSGLKDLLDEARALRGILDQAATDN